MMNELIPFAVIIFLAFLIPEITFKIRIAEVPLLIVAGIAIGPYGFQVITTHIGLDFLASIGFLFLVFLAGLEIKGAKVPKKV